MIKIQGAKEEDHNEEYVINSSNITKSINKKIKEPNTKYALEFTEFHFSPFMFLIV